MLQNTIQTNLSREIVKRQDILDFLNTTLPLQGLFDFPNKLSSERVQLYKKYYFGVGDTECYKINLPNNNQLFMKMEYTNSMGNTHYSRFWLVYLFLCEALGVIDPFKTKLIEVTSGSSGTALALASEVLGYEVTIIVPEILPETRLLPMRRKNVTLLRVPGYIPECITKLREVVKNGDYFPTNHSEEKSDVITFVFSRIASEIINADIIPDYAIIALGNGTTTLAISKTLKSNFENLKISAYQPNFKIKPDDIVFGLIVPNIEFKHLKPALSYIDEIKYTTGINLKYLKDLYFYDTEISNLGFSSLYGVHFALELAKSVKGKNILTIGYDKIDRY